MGRDNSMSKKEKEEAPEVWTEKWGVKIREPQEMPTTMAKFCIETVDKAFEAHPDFDKDGSVISAEIRKQFDRKPLFHSTINVCGSLRRLKTKISKAANALEQHTSINKLAYLTPKQSPVKHQQKK